MKLEIELSDDLAHNIARGVLTTAIESDAINYWIGEDPEDFTHMTEAVRDADGYVVKLSGLVLPDDHEQPGLGKTIDVATDDILKAISLLIKLALDSKRHYLKFLADNDSNTADILVQLAVFKKIVYG